MSSPEPVSSPLSLFGSRGNQLIPVFLGPAHAVYFATYEAVKHLMGGNKVGEHHFLAAATSGACATIASDALMNPFDGIPAPFSLYICEAIRAKV